MSSPAVYLLDTNILIHLIRGRELARYLQAQYGLNTMLAEGLVSVISYGEIFSFAQQQAWEARRVKQMQDLLEKFEPLDINNPQIIEAYADIDAASHALGHKMGKNDLWLAATARTVGIPLMTTDTDFNHLNGTWLTVQWVDPASGRN